MERDLLIHRKIFTVYLLKLNAPRTEFSELLIPILNSLYKWGVSREELIEAISKDKLLDTA